MTHILIFATSYLHNFSAYQSIKEMEQWVGKLDFCSSISTSTH